MTRPEIVATVLNPGKPDGPWDVELALVDGGGEVVCRETVTHGAEGCDWEVVAGPVIDRLRIEARSRGFVGASAEA